MVQVFTIRLALTPPDEVYFTKTKAACGPVLVGMTKKGEVCLVAFKEKQTEAALLKIWKKAWPKTSFVKAPIKLAEKAVKIFGPKGSDVNLLLVGTPFQHKVWAALLDVPEGYVISYKALAERVGSPKAVRAIGGAVGANPVPILIPCHRVIAHDGSLGGFSGGIAMKKKLLKAEALDN